MTVTINTIDGKSHRVDNLTAEQAAQLVLTFTDSFADGFYEAENDADVESDNATYINSEHVASVIVRG